MLRRWFTISFSVLLVNYFSLSWREEGMDTKLRNKILKNNCEPPPQHPSLSDGELKSEENRRKIYTGFSFVIRYFTRKFSIHFPHSFSKFVYLSARTTINNLRVVSSRKKWNENLEINSSLLFLFIYRLKHFNLFDWFEWRKKASQST